MEQFSNLNFKMCKQMVADIAQYFTPFYKRSKYKVSSEYSAADNIKKNLISINITRIQKF
jgi:hypothetical protein